MFLFDTDEKLSEFELSLLPVLIIVSMNRYKKEVTIEFRALLAARVWLGGAHYPG